MSISPELTKEIIVGSVAVFFAAIFSGIPAAVLVWWTWQRDQERLIVQKLLWYANRLGGGEVLIKDKFGPNLDILIRNRSLFPVYVSAVGFEIAGQVLQMEHPYFPSKMKQNPDPMSNYPNIVDEDFDVREIRAGNSLKVSIHDAKDRAALAAALTVASDKYKQSAEDLVNDSKVIAMVALETGKIFTSMPARKRILRRMLQIKREMDGATTAEPDVE